MARWAATKAKAKFSEVLDRAALEGPQLVTRRNQEFYVVMKDQISVQEVLRSEEKPIANAWEAMQPSFKERYDIDFPRLKGKARATDLE